MRIGVGLAFFNAGLLKYRSFDYATQLFEEAYKVPLARSGRCSAHGDDQ